MTTARAWTWTWYADIEQEKIFLEKINSDPKIKYAVWQRELCPSTGREHLQGYMQFDSTVRLSALKKLMPGAHADISRGSAEENTKYCTKAESRKPDCVPVIYGKMPVQGFRTDLAEMAKAVRGGLTNFEMAAEFPVEVMKYGNGIERLRSWSAPRRTVAPTVYYRHGPPGTGKTRWAWETFDDRLFAVVDTGQRFWFTGYNPLYHTAILFDDLNGSHSLNFLLRLLDRYDVAGETKGGLVPLTCSSIVITSNYAPDNLFHTSADIQRKAFVRRLTHIVDTAPPRSCSPDLLALSCPAQPLPFSCPAAPLPFGCPAEPLTACLHTCGLVADVAEVGGGNTDTPQTQKIEGIDDVDEWLRVVLTIS